MTEDNVAEVLLARRALGANPYQVSLVGANFNCGNWTGNSGGKLVIPFQNLDEPIGGNFGPGDIAQVLRLQD